MLRFEPMADLGCRPAMARPAPLNRPLNISLSRSMVAGSSPVRLPWRYFPNARSAFPGWIQSPSTGSPTASCQINELVCVGGRDAGQQERPEQATGTSVKRASRDEEPLAAPATGGTGGASLATKADGQAWHLPVLADRITDLLLPALTKPGSVYVDLTLGMAGHASQILTAAPNARLIGVDQDRQALDIAGAQLARVGIDPARVQLVRARFDELDDVLAGLGIEQVDAVLADLGLSSLQIDQTERGFAYATDAPLDMRMNPDGELTAAEIVNTWPARDLLDIFRRYGEEPNAKRIVAAIEARRTERPFTGSADLVEVIMQSLPAAVRHAAGGGHPAKRVFQALRIAVNGELDALAAMLPIALRRTALGGRVAVISYHSLEDRLVKQHFARAIADDAPADLPFVPADRMAQFRAVTRGAEKPSQDEAELNPRARSARLRVVERVRVANVEGENR